MPSDVLHPRRDHTHRSRSTDQPDSTLTFTATHWGNYEVEARAGRVVGLRPAPADPDPSPIGAGMPTAVNDAVRLRAPMVRKSWLEDGPDGAQPSRGREAFVEVTFDQALGLASRELTRVKAEHGNEAIFGGSYGWGSAGRFHHAQSQLHRFLAMHGGYTDTVNSYSCAALEVILPHVIGGTPWSIFERMPLWDEIAEHGQLVLAFGGIASKNASGERWGRRPPRGAHRKATRCRGRRSVRQHQSPARRRTRLPRRELDRASAEHRCRADAGDRSHVGGGRDARPGFPRALLQWVGTFSPVSGRGGRYPSRRVVGGRDHRRRRRNDPRARSTRGGTPAP